eukprot:m.647117 g.647117  ORF g.647117 m.647117 type:complete len:689 (+) comp22653_c1_seq4:177-2243(+)
MSGFCLLVTIVVTIVVDCSAQSTTSSNLRATVSDAVISHTSILPDISFDGNSEWQFPKAHNVTRNGYNKTTTEVCFPGLSSSILSVSLQLNASALLATMISAGHSTVYFVGMEKIHDLVPGSADYMTAKMKVEASNGWYLATIMDTTYQGIWAQSDVLISRDNLRGAATVTVEFQIQQAKGVMCCALPQLSFSLPPPVFVYPFPSFADNNTVIFDLSLQHDHGGMQAASQHKWTSDSVAFNPNLLSANAQFANVGFGFEDERVQDLLRWLQLPQLRFPGGTIGNYYNWKNDSLYNDQWARSTYWIKQCIDRGFNFGFDGYAKGMRDTNASSVLMFNVIEDSVQLSTARLADRLTHLQNGIDWIELGNENYFPSQGQGHVNHSDVASYIAFTKQLSSALRQMLAQHPRQRSSATGATKTGIAVNVDASNWAAGTWNLQLANQSYYDGCVVHPYVRVSGSFFNAETVVDILTASTHMRGYFDQYKVHFPHTPALLTEWGILGTTIPTFVSTIGRASQFIGTILSLATSPASGVDIVQAGIHILYATNTSDSALFTFDSSANHTVATPTGVWYKKMVDTLIGTDVVPVRAVRVPLLTAATPGVNAFAVETPTSVRVVLVNKLDVVANVSVTSGARDMAHAWTLDVLHEDPMAWPLTPLPLVRALTMQHGCLYPPSCDDCSAWYRQYASCDC